MAFIDDLRLTQAIESFGREIEQFKVSAQDPALINRVRASARRERYTLVLGAGVSKSVNIPLWSELVVALVKRVFSGDTDLMNHAAEFLVSGKFDPLRQVGYLGDLLQFRSTLIREVRRCLYENYDPALEHVLLEPICNSLLVTSSRSRIFNVLTYNFDSALEACLGRLEGSYSVVDSAETYAHASRGLKIFHPHGYLPLADRSESDESIVFSEPDYHTQYVDHTAWANVAQMHHIYSRRCLFIGLSLNDPNMRRLLSLQETLTNPQGERRHVSIQRVSKATVANYFLEKQLGRFGIDVLWVDSPTDIPNVIRCCFD